MSENSFTEVTSQGWVSRIGSSIKGILFGVFLFLASFFLLFWNEGRTVERTQTLNEGSGVVVSVDAITLNPANQEKLIHFSAFVTSDDTLVDKTFDVEAKALRLNRKVEIYQWVETSESHSETAMGGEKTTTTTYSYNKAWKDELKSSGSFKRPEGHINPNDMPFTKRNLTTDNAKAGAFHLSAAMINKLNKLEAFNLDTNKPLPKLATKSIHYYGNGFYIGKESNTPQVGDMKVTYSVLKPQDISVVAQQQGDTVTTYNTEAGGSIAMIVSGKRSAESMFKQAHKDNVMMMWVLRGVGFAMMVIGLSMIFMPLSVIADVVPFIGSIVGGGTVVFAVLMAMVLSLVTVAFAWIFYRPLIGLGLLAIAGGIMWLVKVKFKKNDVATPTTMEKEKAVEERKPDGAGEYEDGI